MKRRILIASAAIAAPLLGLAATGGALAASSTTPVLPKLTQEQQTVLQQMKTLHQAGKHDEAKALLEKADLPNFMHRGHRLMGKMKGTKPVDRKINHDELKAAIEAKDFAKFQELTKDMPFPGAKLDEAGFLKFAQAHQFEKGTGKNAAFGRGMMFHAKK